MKIMFLAAGEGQRLRPFTNWLPKPCMPLLNVPLACYSLSAVLELNPKSIVVNTFHLSAKIEALYKNILPPSMPLHFSHESEGLLGSGGGIMKARKFLEGDESFLVLNADEVILSEDSEFLKNFIAFFQERKPLAAILTKNHPDVGTTFGGAWVDANFRVTEFNKKRPASSGDLRGLHFIGPMMLSDRIFNYLPSSGVSNILYDAMMKGIEAGEEVLAYNIDCEWFETGNPGDLLSASIAMVKKLSLGKSDLVKIFQQFSNGSEVKNHFVFGRDVKISSEAHLEGTVVVGPGTVIKANTRLRDVIIGPGLEISEGRSLKSSIYFGGNLLWTM